METRDPSTARSDFSVNAGNPNTLVRNLIFQCWQTSFSFGLKKKKKVWVKENMPVAIKRKKT